MSQNNASSGGIGIFGLMFVALFVGKVFEIGAVASWSWWWITAPLWGPIAFVIVVFLVIVFAVVLYEAFTGNKSGFRNY